MPTSNMNLLDQFKSIRTFVFDVDGVLTDGSLFIFGNQDYIRRMNIKDGYAMQLAVKKGYRLVVISGSTSPPVVARLNHLGITDVFMKERNKSGRLEAIVKKYQLKWNEVLFMGDDIPDYTAMLKAGLPCAPADAVSEIRQIAKYISPWNGGYGCVRDVIEKVLKLNNHWDLQTDIPSQ